MNEPKAGRPHMPGYGIVGPDQGSGLLPWSWAEERLIVRPARAGLWTRSLCALGRPARVFRSPAGPLLEPWVYGSAPTYPLPRRGTNGNKISGSDPARGTVLPRFCHGLRDLRQRSALFGL